jgi:glycosyltransferase involved in cell wall biosynthesis
MPAMSSRHGLLLVTTSFPAAADGSEAAGAFVADLAARLAERAEVRVVAPGERHALESRGAYVVRRFPAPPGALSGLRPAHPADWPRIASVLRAGMSALEDAVALGATPAHTLALWALPSGWWARRLARRRGIPYSTWALGSDIWSLGRIPLVRGVLRRVLRDAAHRFADGMALAADVRALAGAEVDFLPTSRDIGEAPQRRLRDSPPYVLTFLGRWHPNKGVDLGLDALARLDARDWQRIAEVRIHGGGVLEREVRSRVDVLRAAGRPVVLGGYLATAAARELLLHTDYLMIPSRIESIPVVYSDAMALRCPVIVSPVGDLPALVERHGVGVVASAVDASAFAAAIRAALDQAPAPMRERFGLAAAEFSLPRRVVPRLLQLCGAAA